MEKWKTVKNLAKKLKKMRWSEHDESWKNRISLRIGERSDEELLDGERFIGRSFSVSIEHTVMINGDRHSVGSSSI